MMGTLKGKKMKFLIIMIGLGMSLFAGELQFEHAFNKAVQEAKDQNKTVMMMYSAVWCPECNYMKDVVLKDQKVVDYIQKRFIVLTLDVQKDDLPKGFEYPGIPTFFFLDQNAKEKDKIIGGDKADNFLQRLKAVK